MTDFMLKVAIALPVAWFVYEIKEWSPRAIEWLIRIALRQMPRCHRKYHAEEWRAHIWEVPGGFMKIWDAVGFIVAARKIYPSFNQRVAGFRKLQRVDMVTRAIDIVFSLTGLIAVLPVMAVAMLLLRSSGPAIFVQRRVGRNGLSIGLFKLRTMPVACYSATNDPADRLNITRLGRLLRWTRIDELPLLINVLKGDISLVGPPLRHPALYNGEALGCIAFPIPSVRPGITGFAQLNSALPSHRLAGVKARARGQRSVGLYFKIMWLTCLAIFQPHR